MTESFTDDMDVPNNAVELSSPPPFHHAAVKGQSRHSDAFSETCSNAGVAEASERLDSLEAPSQVTGVGRAKRIRGRSSEPTLDTERNIGITDE